MLPSQIQRVLIFLIHKATRGRPPIILAPALYRCRAMARRPLAEEWDVSSDHPFLAVAKGRTSLRQGG